MTYLTFINFIPLFSSVEKDSFFWTHSFHASLSSNIFFVALSNSSGDILTNFSNGLFIFLFVLIITKEQKIIECPKEKEEKSRYYSSTFSTALSIRFNNRSGWKYCSAKVLLHCPIAFLSLSVSVAKANSFSTNKSVSP